MSWSFYVEHGGLVWPDPGQVRPGLKEALRDCAESLSPIGTAPELSTYWIDRILERLSHEATAPVIASGNAWSLVREGDVVKARLDYAEEGEEAEAISVEELVDGLTAYRDAVIQSIESGHRLDGRWWAQRNPG